MKRFLVDFGGEEEMPTVHPGAREEPTKYTGRVLPKYIITGDSDRQWATDFAQRQYKWSRGFRRLNDYREVPEMWIVKVILLGKYEPVLGRFTSFDPPYDTWAIATNDKYLTTEWYHINTNGFPAVLHHQGIVNDSSSTEGLIELASMPEKAPWWEEPYKQGALEDIFDNFDELSPEEIDELADHFGIIFARGVTTDRKIGVLMDEFVTLPPLTVDSIESYIQDYIDNR